MLKRFVLAIALIGVLGGGAIIANAAQKDKAKTKELETKERAEKDKLLEFQRGALAVDFPGAGGYLGVYLEEVTPERAKELKLGEERGAIVMKVVADSPADKAGLKENDVIVSFNGRRVDSVRELQRLLNETPPDRSVQIDVFRASSRQTLSATLAKRSNENFKLLGQYDERLWQQNEEAMKRMEESFKQSEEAYKRMQEKWKDQPNFGDFTFVSPGEFRLFGTTRLGIGAESLTDQLAEFFGVKDSKGVLVASVYDDGPAAKAGLKAGDVITAIDNQKIDSVNSLLRALSAKEEGTVAVRIVRNRAEQVIQVKIEKREFPTPKRRASSYTRRTPAG